MSTDSSVINAAMNTFALEIAAGAGRKSVQRAGDWTTEDVLKLRQLWSEGVSASIISEKIPGKSRNAVIGKAHRLKLAPRLTTRRARVGPPSRPRGPYRAKAVTRAVVVKPEPFMPRPEPLPTDLVGFMENKGCMFSALDWGKKFCGRPKQNGSYCEEHARRTIRA